MRSATCISLVGRWSGITWPASQVMVSTTSSPVPCWHSKAPGKSAATNPPKLHPMRLPTNGNSPESSAVMPEYPPDGICQRAGLHLFVQVTEARQCVAIERPYLPGWATFLRWGQRRLNTDFDLGKVPAGDFKCA